MSPEAKGTVCPRCGGEVVDQPSTCPHCGLTFLSVCSCGSTWHLLHPRCPACGRKHKIRRKVDRRLWKRKRFRLAVFGAALLALLLVNVYVVLMQRPEKGLSQAYEAYDRGDFEEAVIRFRGFLETEPDHEDASYMLGLALIHLGKEDEAIRMLEKATEIADHFPLAQIALSEYYRRQGRYREALERARLATEREPTPTEAFIALGDALLAVGDARGAIEGYKRALEMDPARIEIQLKLADLYLTRKYLGLDRLAEGLAMDRYRRAEELSRRILSANREDLQARIWLAKARAGQGFLGDAIEQLERVVDREPEDPAHRLLLARLHDALGDYEAEDLVLAEALETVPTAELAIQRAEVLGERLKDPTEARSVLLDAIEREPDHAGLRIALAAFYRNRDQLGEASKVLEEAVERIPGHAGLLMARGDLALATEDEEAAVAAWRIALELDPGSVSARKKIVKVLLPGVVEELSRGRADPSGLSEVEAHLAWFLDPETGLNPSDEDARDWAARLAFTRGDFDRAAELLGSRAGGDPGSWAGLRLLGVSWLNRDPPDYARASRALHTALQHPDCPQTFEDFELAWIAAYRTGHYSREAEIAGAAVAKWPRDVDWRLRWATSLFRDDKPGPALRECENARTRLAGTTDVRAHLLASRILQATGDLSGARRSLEAAVAIRRDAETRGALYSFLAATGDQRLADQGFRALVEENPDDPEAFLRFGDFLLRRGDDSGALTQFQRALELAPDSSEAIYRVAELKMARAATDEGQLSAAREALTSLREADPDDPFLDYFTGKVHLLLGENEQAVTALGRYSQRNRNDPAGLYYLGIAYRRTDDLKRAGEAFLAALRMDPGMSEAKLQLATLYFTQGLRAHGRGELAEARDRFEQVAGLDPNEPDTHRFLADSLAGLGFLDDAMVEAGTVLDLAPDDPGALFLAGVIAALQGDFETAEEKFRALVDVAPENFRSHLHLAQVLAEQRRFGEARDALREAWQRAPEEEDVLATSVLVEIADGKPEEALRILESEEQRRPGRPVVLHYMGNAYKALGRPREAVAAWMAAFEANPDDVAALYLAAAVTADEGDLGKAIVYLTDGEKRATRKAPLLALKGGMLVALGETERAEQAFRESLAEDPDHLPALRGLGMLLAQNGREEEGARLLEKAVEAGLEHPAVHFRLARVAQARGDREGAIRHYRATLDLAPEESSAMNNLALLLSGSPEGIPVALELAERARGLAPDDPRTLDTLGWILYRAERYDEATDTLREAAAALPDSVEVQFHAGMAAFKSYRWDEAKPWLERALDLDAEFAAAEEAKAALERMK